EAKIEAAPFTLDPLESGLQFAIVLKIQRQEDGCINLSGARLDMWPRFVVEVGHGYFGAEGAKSLGAAPCDRLIVRDARDQRLLPLEQRQRRWIDHIHASASRT